MIPQSETDQIENTILELYKGKSTNEMIDVFASKSRQDYHLIFSSFALTERQVANWYGKKDELFLQELIRRIIRDLKRPSWSVDKITSARDERMGLRQVGKSKMYFGGDSVLFKDSQPKCIIQCKEYLDTIRVKELVGESLMLKALTDGAIHTGPIPLFVVFANVWELTPEWQESVQKLGLRGYIDEFFVVRPGKRKDVNARPMKAELLRFKGFIEGVIRES